MLMMFSPVRSAMAMEQSHCDMNDNVAVDSAIISEHLDSEHSGHNMMAMPMIDDSGIQKSENAHDCCSGSNSCVDNCNIHVSVSLLTHETTYIPNLTNVSESVVLIPDLIKKEFTPPFRPPLFFHS